MKLLFYSLLFFIVPKLCISQTSANDRKIYLDSTWNETTSANYKYYKIIKDYYTDQKEYKVMVYYKNDQLQKESTLSGKDGGSPNGEEINYYENGKKESTITYINGRPTGKSKSWYENGNIKAEKEYTGIYEIPGKEFMLNQYWDENKNHLIVDGNGIYSSAKDGDYFETGKYKNGYKDGIYEAKNLKDNTSYVEEYEDGKFISGTRTFSDNTKLEYFEIMKKPFPKKGLQDFYEFIGKNYRTPNKQGLKGKVFITFVVDKDGKIVEPKIIRDLGYGTGTEAIRVVMAYDGFVPGEHRGQKIRCAFSLPITIQSPN
jgi:hypothetical protein